MADFIEKKATIRSVRDMNVRIGSPTIKAKAIATPKGKTFEVIGHVTDGDDVNGNAKWYRTPDDQYIWSGNVEVIIEEITKIFSSPLKKLICTQKFGLRPEVYKNFGCPKGHNGLDFRTWVDGNASKWKQPVFAVLDGKVSEAGNDPKFKGNYVRIKHDNGFESVYLHMDSLKVKKGDRMIAGEQIGISGNTGGASEAPHLHFGYRPVKCNVNDGYMGYIDPINLFINEIMFV